DYAVKGRPLSDAKKALAEAKRFDPNYNLLKALVYCHGRVAEIVSKSANADVAANYLINLVKYIRDSTAVVRLTVPNEASAFMVFETLNDRGLDLSAMDLVKNLLFSLAVSHSTSWLSDMEQRWAQMMVTLANVKAHEFLKVYWTSRNGRVQAADLYSDIKKSCATAVAAVDLSIDMLLASEQYAALDNADDPVWAQLPPEVRNSIRALKILGSKQVRPVILAAVVKLEAGEFVRLLRLLEVVIVRYQLIGGERTGRIEIACARLAELIFSGKTKTATQAHTELHDIYLSDDDFRQAFLLKQEGSNQKTQYLLRQLEQEVRRIESGKMPGEETLGQNLTVEHVLPRNAGDEWKSIIDANPNIVDECAERLGNLCLLTKVNKDLGRAAFEKKRPVFADSKIRITAELAKSNTWDRKTIEGRQAAMAKMAVNIWRFQ
ncbi:MAG: HNH endonuclease family protein, partial [Burkholderiales bacterium]